MKLQWLQRYEVQFEKRDWISEQDASNFLDRYKITSTRHDSCQVSPNIFFFDIISYYYLALNFVYLLDLIVYSHVPVCIVNRKN